MGRNRQPVALIKAKGNSHLGKSELRQRLEQELHVDLTAIEIPNYLPEVLHSKFDDIAAKLLHIGVFTELDEDLLARYLIAEANYLRLTQLLNQALSEGDPDTVSKLQRSQNAAFNQCHTCASSLGLTITSRCKLVVPDTGESKVKKSKFAQFEV